MKILFTLLIGLVFSLLVSAEEEGLLEKQTLEILGAVLTDPVDTSEKLEETVLEAGTFSVNATVYDHRNTYLVIDWLEDGVKKKAMAWSNVNWKHLGGFSRFRCEYAREYRFFLLAKDVSLVKLREIHGNEALTPPRELPKQRDEGAQYQLISGNTPELVEFLDTIHALYAQEKRRLMSAYKQRDRFRKIPIHTETEKQ